MLRVGCCPTTGCPPFVRPQSAHADPQGATKPTSAKIAQTNWNLRFNRTRIYRRRPHGGCDAAHIVDTSPDDMLRPTRHWAVLSFGSNRR
jgi:hypothetical protein